MPREEGKSSLITTRMLTGSRSILHASLGGTRAVGWIPAPAPGFLSRVSPCPTPPANRPTCRPCSTATRSGSGGSSGSASIAGSPGSSIPRACWRWPAKRSNAAAASRPGRAAGSFLWLRQIVGEVLQRIHQQRLGPDVRGDISLYRGALPEATSISLAAHLLGKGGGDDDRAAARAEQKILLQETLNAMDPLDREVLTLRHCEQLSNDETATVLDISPAQASEAYVRALKRISVIMASLPGFQRKASK